MYLVWSWNKHVWYGMVWYGIILYSISLRGPSVVATWARWRNGAVIQGWNDNFFRIRANISINWSQLGTHTYSGSGTIVTMKPSKVETACLFTLIFAWWRSLGKRPGGDTQYNHGLGALLFCFSSYVGSLNFSRSPVRPQDPGYSRRE